jgi:hypothetical protein
LNRTVVDAHVDPDLHCREARKDAIRPRRDILEDDVGRNGREDDLRGLRDLARRIALDQPLAFQLPHLSTVSRLAVDRVSGIEEYGRPCSHPYDQGRQIPVPSRRPTLLPTHGRAEAERMTEPCGLLHATAGQHT